ncbi:MAG: hypothetical protein BWK73_13920 [Thiothrix lacustris]|uniref:Uncharacterized protein n=1 Tax=Thiothrix lacustris TaxID=525917 RepID=A0A1Y1QSG1_9GAMM|nr:MAG: hypothetical protein BWK73_13920 [Thiothrix lacustris]
MFLKATTQLVNDTVIIRDTDGNEITRFVAVWQRPDSKTRKALLKARMANLKSLQTAQLELQADPENYDAEAFSATLSAIEDDGKARIRQHLNRIDGLLDDTDQPVDFTPAVIDELFRWTEYTTPLAESLARLAEGRTVEEARLKNSVPLVGTGPVAPAVAEMAA